ncbi:hypothetical protein JVT61DRAFT_2321 [Boletus reticuloceps]|uniref:Uncharacterized protein n=1 Tax=Boletus reticuloceps TaxID=495285 RepID=A0A8I2YP40_9AGAM|nr:hypothetical protein JVT61DRAFT_2321 [Boletus reticuloceps]
MGARAVGTFHSTATLSTQRVSAACMGFGPCTVGIFSCLATATLAGQAILFFGSYIIASEYSFVLPTGVFLLRITALSLYQRLEAVDDLASLSAVSDDVIVTYLHECFVSDTIYTNIGSSVLVAVNCFKHRLREQDSLHPTSSSSLSTTT